MVTGAAQLKSGMSHRAVDRMPLPGLGSRGTLTAVPKLAASGIVGDAENAAIWLCLTRIIRQLHRVAERRLRRVGLPPVIWHDALLLLASEPDGEIRVTDLEYKLPARQYQVSRLVAALRQGGCVARRTMGNRLYVIRLTTRGRELQQKMAAAYWSIIDTEITSQFSEEDASVLVALLNCLCGTETPSDEPKSTWAETPREFQPTMRRLGGS